jgi:starch synthase
MEKRRVLYVTQEMNPYMGEESSISKMCRDLPQKVLESGYEIRNFMPRFGCINERRHQLHEVIRLSGMNLVVNDSDQPLIIKVASIPVAKMQVYFIDNEEYFKRKHTLNDADGNFYADNDERAIFFARGVLETVKKLGWIPDIIHCHGWMSSLVPVYLKTALKEDPIYQHAKVVMSVYGCDTFTGSLNQDFAKKVLWQDMIQDDYTPEGFSYPEILKAGLRYVDAVVAPNGEVCSEIKSFIDKEKMRVLELNEDADYVADTVALYEELLEESVLAH